ncbi:MAG: hypothetical protein ABIG56_04750 [Candidatus Omnitrophota bacterium]
MRTRILRQIILSVVLSVCLFIIQAEAGTITLRVVAVNPSEELSQTAPIKVHLPKEVKPEHIVYMADMQMAYDAQMGSYYVFGDYELKPKEMLEKEIEIKDIWIIDNVDIADLRLEAKEIFGGFEKTKMAKKAQAMNDAINDKLDEIQEKQLASSTNPSQHISDYRYCISLFNEAKKEVVEAKTLLQEIEPEGLTALTWKIIIFIIAFLGILGFTFYIIWQKQAKMEAAQKIEETKEEGQE